MKMKWKKASIILMVIVVIAVGILFVFRRELYINYLAYREDRQFSQKELTSDPPSDRLIFDSTQSSDNPLLQYTTLLGRHGEHLKSENPILYPTKNGLYTIDWVRLDEDNHSSAQEEKLITRTDFQGNILWTFQLEKEYSLLPLKGIYTSSSFVDEEENIYVQGHVATRFFLWKRWVPRQHSHFLVSINEEGDINWVYFTDTYLYFSHGVVKDHKVYLTTLKNPIDSKHDHSTIICLDAQNGDKLWDIETSFVGESVFFSPFGIHIANSSSDKDKQMVHANLKTVSYEGENLWEKTFDFPAALSESLPYRNEILYSANQQHLYVCFCTNGWEISQMSSEVVLEQTSKIVSLDSYGGIQWEYQIPNEENKWIHSMECNQNQLCIAGGTTKQTENAKEDVFLTCFSSKGEVFWNIYVEGEEAEPYHFFRPDIDPGSFVEGGLYLQMTEDTIVLATSTQSKDIRIHNGVPFHLSLQVASYTQPLKKPCYSVLYMFNLQGSPVYSTYTTTNSNKERERNSQEAMVYIKSDYFVADWIHDMKIYNNKVYTLSSSNNLHTRLHNSAASSLPYFDKEFRGYFYLLSCYEM